MIKRTKTSRIKIASILPVEQLEAYGRVITIAKELNKLSVELAKTLAVLSGIESAERAAKLNSPTDPSTKGLSNE